MKKQNICENCKTGKETFELDSSLPMCPYISNWRNNECSFYEPMEISEKVLTDEDTECFETK